MGGWEGPPGLQLHRTQAQLPAAWEQLWAEKGMQPECGGAGSGTFGLFPGWPGFSPEKPKQAGKSTLKAQILPTRWR